MRFGHCRIGFQLADQFVVSPGLFPRQINVKDEQRNQPHDGHIVRRRTNLPKLSPIHKFSTTRVGTAALGCSVERSSTRFLLSTNPPSFAWPDSRGRLSPRGSSYFLGSFTSEASITGAGPEMPPS